MAPLTNREATTKGTKPYKLSGTVGATKVTVECETESSTAATRIEGGDGEGETGDASGTLELSACKVGSPAGCKVKTPIVAHFESELAEETGKTGEVLLLLQPAEDGTSFTEVSLEGAECKVKGTFKVTGTEAAKTSPKVGEEALTDHLILPSTPITEVIELSEGKRTTIKVGLSIEKAAATLSGESEVKLNSKEAFGTA